MARRPRRFHVSDLQMLWWLSVWVSPSKVRATVVSSCWSWSFLPVTHCATCPFRLSVGERLCQWTPSSWDRMPSPLSPLSHRRHPWPNCSPRVWGSWHTNLADLAHAESTSSSADIGPKFCNTVFFFKYIWALCNLPLLREWQVFVGMAESVGPESGNEGAAKGKTKVAWHKTLSLLMLICTKMNFFFFTEVPWRRRAKSGYSTLHPPRNLSLSLSLFLLF